jgi:hypothetical protein
MSHRSPPSPTQLNLRFDDIRNRPPPAPPTPEVLDTLAELLLAAMTGLQDGEAGDEPENRR